MAVTYITVGAVGLNHEPVQGHLLDNLTVLFSLHRAPIDSDVQVHLAKLFHLFNGACERVHHASRKLGAICFHYVIKVAIGSSGMQVHGQLELLSNLKVWFKGQQLIIFTRILEPVVIKAALADRDELSGLTFAQHRSNFLEIGIQDALFVIS